MSNFTPVTPLATALGTTDDIASYLGATNQTDQEKALMQRTVNAATKRIESYCRRPFLARTIVEVQSGRGLEKLYLRAHPIVSVTQVELINWDGTTFDTYSGSELVADLAKGTVRLASGASFAEGTENWKATYSASYATLAAVPDDVIVAFLALSAHLWRKHSQKRDDIASQSKDGQTVFYKVGALPEHVVDLLKPYRIPFGITGE